MIIYGPVPSRRLGQSIGFNNIPPKTCSYSCLYCQLGRTDRMRASRGEFYKPESICREAGVKLGQLDEEKRQADYFSFVPDGEPTLDKNLGRTIDLLKPFGVKIAVITNASLIWMKSVRADLVKADWVSVSIDAADESTWRRMDRPHGALKHRDILNGIIEFSKEYGGTLVTETMLVEGVNDGMECVEKIAEHLEAIRPDKAYLLVPTRPPAERGVKRPPGESVRSAAGIIRGISGAEVELITGDEKEEGFFVSGDVAADLLSIAAVHPIREEIAHKLLEKRSADRSVITELVARGEMTAFSYEGKKFYKKNIHKK